MQARHVRGAAAVAASLLLPGCVAHPVSPARTAAKYEAEAVTTAEVARSAARTGVLTAQAASGQRTFGPYTSVVLSEQESALHDAAGTFASVQPPGGRSQRLRTELLGLLDRTTGDAASLRIAARQDRLGDLGPLARHLSDDADRLDAFVRRHR